MSATNTLGASASAQRGKVHALVHTMSGTTTFILEAAVARAFSHDLIRSANEAGGPPPPRRNLREAAALGEPLRRPSGR